MERKEPTVDLSRLYKGKGDPTEVEDFTRLQLLLSDPHRAVEHLRFLNGHLADAMRTDPLPEEAGPRAEKANELLDRVLDRYERQCGFACERPVLVGFASADDFKVFTAEGRHFYDVGAGLPHGEMTHRIQWFIIMREVTGGSFAGVVPPYHHTPRRLFAASMKQAYTIPATSPTGVTYMWDWVVDRIKGQVPLDPKGEPDYGIDYDGRRDAWTHPGEAGTPGGLSIDLIDGGLEGVDELAAVRFAQYKGNAEQNQRLARWFTVADELKAAEGTVAKKGDLVLGATATTYFHPPSAPALAVLRAGRVAAGELAHAVRSLEAPVAADRIERLSRECKQRFAALAEEMDCLQRATRQRLGGALLGAWFRGLDTALTVGVTAIDKGVLAQRDLDPVLQAVDALEGSSAWKLDLG